MQPSVQQWKPYFVVIPRKMTRTTKKDEDDSDYKGDSITVNSDGDNEEFEDNCIEDVEDDLGRCSGGDPEDREVDKGDEESDFVDSDDHRTVHSLEDNFDDAHVSEFHVDRDMEKPKFSL
ncbi:unnamed protein product [Linum trigynum]|uniref:Uncharacterized protein n=1 Tax=Linum trigynum TaxID=586398 RepID=A0AAV2GCK0_9ROSI